MIIVGPDWGKVAKCPFCERTDIPRTVFNQLTCGGARCRALQNHAAQKQSRQRSRKSRGSSAASQREAAR